MRVTEFMIVIVAALLFLIPMMNKEKEVSLRQAQEEVPSEEIMTGPHTYKIIYEVQVPKDEPIADIIWMKKAAEVAQEAGIPYFNVLKQKVRKQYVHKYKTDLSVVEGIIQLDNDPMRAEFDAQEIESLVLTDSP